MMKMMLRDGRRGRRGTGFVSNLRLVSIATLLLIGLVLLSSSSSSSSFFFVSSYDYDTGTTRALIKWKDTVDVDELLNKLLEFADDGQILEFLAKLFLVSIAINELDRDAILARISASEVVDFVEIDQVRGSQEHGPHRPLSPHRVRELQRNGQTQPYGIAMVQADQLWSLPETNTDAKVCVVDTGFNAGHEDLPPVLDPNTDVDGTSTAAGTWYTDVNGHGTHCSGTIGAVNNNVGVVGVRDDPTHNVFHSGRGLGDDGSGYSSTILGAVQGCVDEGAKVVSLSLGGEFSSRSEENFYNDLYNQGVLIVAAAGNNGDSGYMYPAAYKSVMSVAAVGDDGFRAPFSQCNDQVEVAAPGVDILSTYPPNRYAELSGTSMACPMVAGVAAQLMTYFPDCTNYQIRNVLSRTAIKVGELDTCNNGYGSGLIQAKDAYDVLLAEGCNAGGPIIDNPAGAAVGGCEQNPMYDSTNNTDRNTCPGFSITPSPASLPAFMYHGSGTAVLLMTALATTASIFLMF